MIDLEEDEVVGRLDFPSKEDRVSIGVRCGTTSRDYEVTFVKGTSNRYGVFDIKTMKSKSKGVEEMYETKERYNAEEFDWDGVNCPYCPGRLKGEEKYGLRTNVLQCVACGRMSCGGGIKVRGRTLYFTCPWCGKGGIIDAEPFEDFSIPISKKNKY